jgi:predicted helicase
LRNSTVSKSDLDSFISASSTNDFSRLLLVDTSTQDLGKHAQNVLDNLDKEYVRIPLEELEQSRIDWLTYVREDRVRLYSKKEPRDHQVKALKAVKEGLAEADMRASVNFHVRALHRAWSA